MTFFIAIFVLLMQFLWKYIDELVGKGLDWRIIGELLLYSTAGFVPMALPLAILLASLMTFGNLGENYELTAIKAAGISLSRVLFPLLIFILFLSTAEFVFANRVIPYTTLKAATLLYDVRHKRPELNLKAGEFNNEVEGYSIRIDRKNIENKMMYGFMIYDHSAHRGNVSVTLADSARMEITKDRRYLILNLFNGSSYQEVTEKKKGYAESHPFQRDTFMEKNLIVELEGFTLERTDEGIFRKNHQMLNLSQLTSTIDSLNKNYSNKTNELTYRIINSDLAKREIKDTSLHKTIVKNLGWEKYSIVPAKNDSTDALKFFEAYDNTIKYATLETAINQANMTYKQIESNKEELKSNQRWMNRYEVEWHRKFTLAFACFIFFFIGAPLGAIIRKGGLGMPVVISVIFFIVYYVISLTGEKFLRESILPGYIGMWISSYVLLPLGAFLTYKATRDSSFMNIDTYIEPIRRLIGKLRKTKKI